LRGGGALQSGGKKEKGKCHHSVFTPIWGEKGSRRYKIHSQGIKEMKRTGKCASREKDSLNGKESGGHTVGKESWLPSGKSKRVRGGGGEQGVLEEKASAGPEKVTKGPGLEKVKGGSLHGLVKVESRCTMEAKIGGVLQACFLKKDWEGVIQEKRCWQGCNRGDLGG